MSAVLICDKCSVDIQDGASLKVRRHIKYGTHIKDEDYCNACLDRDIMEIINEPGFDELVLYKVGIHKRH